MTSKIHNRARIRQIIDFDGLEWGKLRPTDIDLSIDWQGKTFVFVELKSAGTALTLGQRIHLEGLVKAIRAGGRLAWAVFAQHDTDVSEDVTAADAVVSSIYEGDKWIKQINDTPTLLSDTLNTFYDVHQKTRGA